MRRQIRGRAPLVPRARLAVGPGCPAGTIVCCIPLGRAREAVSEEEDTLLAVTLDTER
jgi:hypothetical protein